MADMINNIGSVGTNFGSLMGIVLAMMFCLMFLMVGNRHDAKTGKGQFGGSGIILVIFAIGLVLLGASAGM